jgi:hypothetical protein
MGSSEVERQSVGSIQQAQASVQWRSSVNTAMNSGFIKRGNCIYRLSNLSTLKVKSLLHEVSQIF